jgi:hypothetical protein
MRSLWAARFHSLLILITLRRKMWNTGYRPAVMRVINTLLLIREIPGSNLGPGDRLC